MKERSTKDGGMGAYSPQSYADHGLDEYRTRFPEVTKPFSDEQLFHIISNMDDDMDDADWVELFTKHSATAE